MSERLSLQTGLEGRYYVDPSIFAAERERIFHPSWQFVATTQKLAKAGSYATIDVAGAAVFAVRGEDGVVRAFRNICRHRGSRLLEGAGDNCREIRCPYHGWRYGLDGALVETPWFDEETPFNLASFPLTPAAVAVWRGLIFVSVNPAGSLADQLGDLPRQLVDAPLEDMSEVSHPAFRAPFNWKVYIDQFTEYYHTPAVHAPDKNVGMQHFSAAPFHQGMLMQSPPGSAFYGGKWVWGWPNWTISTFPGGAKLSRVLPVSPEESEICFKFLFADIGEAGAAQRQRVIDATLQIFNEDVAALRRVQANLSSGFFEEPGPLHPRHEDATAYFQRKLREALA